MDEDQAPDQGALFPKSLGDRLREAREAKGLTLADVASTTRVPLRHLEAIETDRYDGLPSPTYAIGFAKSYARAVGLDDQAIAAELRASPQMPLSPSIGFEEYAPADPKRVPSRGLAMAAGLVAVVLLVGVVIWYGSGWLRGSGDGLAVPTPEASETSVASPEASPTPVSGGQVVLTATSRVWVSVRDGDKKLYEEIMDVGKTYDVPMTGNPTVSAAQADKLKVTINGSDVAPLAEGKGRIKDVPISAAALQARGSAAAAPTATPTPDASPRASSTSSSARSGDVPRAFRTPTSTPTPRASSTPRSAPTANPVSAPTAAPTATP